MGAPKEWFDWFGVRYMLIHNKLDGNRCISGTDVHTQTGTCNEKGYVPFSTEVVRKYELNTH